MNFTFTHDFYGVEFDVECEYSPSIPGKYYGKPEDCYPDEPAYTEWEIIGMTDKEVVDAITGFDDKDPIALLKELHEELSNICTEKGYEGCVQAKIDYEADRAEAIMEERKLRQWEGY